MKMHLPTATKRQSTSHQIHTTKHHICTLTLNPPSLQNKTTDAVIQQHSRKLLMMDILMSETCWAHKKWNKIASDIKLVFYSSTKILHVSEISSVHQQEFFHCTHSNGICHTCLLTACEQDQDGTVWHTIAVCIVENSWWWTEELSETCRVLFQK